MKKVLSWGFVATLICGLNVFTSCDSDNNHARPSYNLAEKIIGKWMTVDIDGQPALTNQKEVITFVSPTKAYLSRSHVRSQKTDKNSKSNDSSDSKRGARGWKDYDECDVKIEGNTVTLTTTGRNSKYLIQSISESEFVCEVIRQTSRDGELPLPDNQSRRYEKVITDYSEAVLGLWECTELTGIETYNDANARLEFLADGTYRYYRMDDNNDWQTVTTREFQDYFVDGTLLATRWKNQGEDELREWWEIESLSGNEMVWTALRQNPDGSTFQQKMTWKKIDLKVSEKIIGKWIFVERNGEPTPSNKKRVYNFVSPTKAYISASDGIGPVVSLNWLDKTEADVTFFGNKVTLTVQNDEHTTMVDEYTVTAINDTEIIANLKVTSKVDGNVVFSQDGTMRFEKVTADFSADIIGTWEGHCTSEGSVFDDGQEHRWQYNADGTYVYYVKDGDNWVPYEGNTLNEYFVDGNLLCTRWIDNGVENREWWEINIDGDKMNWTALRQNEDGSTFTATFEMTKVQ